MQELDNCLEYTRDIKAKDEIILEIRYRTLSPKNQIITDMPKGGGGNSNLMDSYLVKIERIERSKDALKEKRKLEWEKAKAKFNDTGITNAETVELMRLRFCCGLSWKKCALKMKELYPESKWNINKCFRVYRDVCTKAK